MKIGVFGDLHGGDPKEIIEEFNSMNVNLILANGDFISCRNKDLENILEQVISNANANVIVIPGNYENPYEWKNAIKSLTKEYNNIIDNNRKKYMFGDYNIVSYGGGTVIPACASEIFLINPLIEISELVPIIDENTILQLHEPPKYYGDTACAYIKGNRITPLPCNSPFANKYHVGNEQLTYLIEGEFGDIPRLTVAGHIHEAKTAMRVNSREKDKSAYNLFVNPGAAKEGHYEIIEINDVSTKVIT